MFIYHVLFSFIVLYYRPGGKIKAGEDSAMGLKRKLIRKLAPVQVGEQPEFEVGLRQSLIIEN